MYDLWIGRFGSIQDGTSLYAIIIYFYLYYHKGKIKTSLVNLDTLILFTDINC